MRFLLGAENEGAGSIFNSFYERNRPRAADRKKNMKFHMTIVSKETMVITSSITSTFLLLSLLF